LVGLGLWALYVYSRLEQVGEASQTQGIGAPFVGFVQAFESWLADPMDLVVGLSVVLLLVLFVRRVVMSPHVLGWAFLGFVALAVVLTEPVWHSYFDISRAIAPVLTAFVVILFAVPKLGSDTRRRS
jgi:hypothetical protein